MALVDALRLDVVRELHLGESVRDVKVSAALIFWLPGDRLEVASESDYCVNFPVPAQRDYVCRGAAQVRLHLRQSGEPCGMLYIRCH